MSQRHKSRVSLIPSRREFLKGSTLALGAAASGIVAVLGVVSLAFAIDVE